MKTLMMAVALTASIAGATTAKAWDQQATGAEMDYELSRQATGNDGGAYASARVPGRVHVRTPAISDRVNDSYWRNF
jgi:hypothetical protein